MTGLEREMAADAVALSKEHADRAAPAEARWTALRDHIREERAHHDLAAAEFAERGHLMEEARRYARVNAMDEVLATMDRMEAGE